MTTWVLIGFVVGHSVTVIGLWIAGTLRGRRRSLRSHYDTILQLAVNLDASHRAALLEHLWIDATDRARDELAFGHLWQQRREAPERSAGTEADRWREYSEVGRGG